MIYKHAISTIVPSRAVRIPYDTPDHPNEDDDTPDYPNEDDIDQNNLGQNQV